MNRVVSQIQNGQGRLILSESFLVDLRETAYLDVPTVQGLPYRLQFKFAAAEGLYAIPQIEVSKYSANILEVVCKFVGSTPGYVATRNWVDIRIAGQAYKALFIVSKVHDSCGRIEVTLYEV